jgi:acetyl-CoA carboxylase biotin carboxylase subunit
VAQGLPVPAQEEVLRRGHAIEARIYAEDPDRGFLPSPGKITYLRLPGGPGIRDDSGVHAGWTVSPFYDPLLSKLVAWAPTRAQAIDRLIRALSDYVVHGLTTNVAWLARVLDHPAFRSGEYDTGFCARYARELAPRPDPALEELALIAAAVEAHRREREEAERFAVRAAGQGLPSGSAWARLGRGWALRGGRP